MVYEVNSEHRVISTDADTPYSLLMGSSITISEIYIKLLKLK
jgi:hypothetical protein